MIWLAVANFAQQLGWSGANPSLLNNFDLGARKTELDESPVKAPRKQQPVIYSPCAYKQVTPEPHGKSEKQK